MHPKHFERILCDSCYLPAHSLSASANSCIDSISALLPTRNTGFLSPLTRYTSGFVAALAGITVAFPSNFMVISKSCAVSVSYNPHGEFTHASRVRSCSLQNFYRVLLNKEPGEPRVTVS